MISFKKRLGQLFDVAHQDFDSIVGLNRLTIFLSDQRGNRTKKFDFIQQSEITQNGSRCGNANMVKEAEISERHDVVSSDDEIDEDDSDYELVMVTKGKKSVTPSGSDFINEVLSAPTVTSAVDRVGLSDEQFRMILAPIAVVAKAEPSKTWLSRSTIKRKREGNRAKIVKKMKTNFTSTAASKQFVVHWDGKLMADLMNPDYASKKYKVDRIAVAVSENGENKLLGIPRIETGTGFEMARVVFDEIEKWEIRKNVIGLCCDTTASNTGNKNGAASLLQSEFFDADLLIFPCRHHIQEVVLGGVFVELFGPSSGPNIDLFVDFRKNWNNIKIKTDLQCLPESSFNSPLMKRLRTETISSLQATMTKYNGALTYNEGQKQNIIQIVEDHCRRFSKKSKKNELFC